VTYVDDLGRSLSGVGIGGSLRARIVAEFADHLACDPDADLGAPALVAQQFADQLGTGRARRAALVAFGALSVAGALFAAVFVAALLSGYRYPRLHLDGELPGGFAVGLMVIGPQVALVSGLAGLLRAWRLRGEVVLPRAEGVVLVHRALVGVFAGFASIAGLALLMLEYGDQLPGWLGVLGYACAGAGAVALAVAVPFIAGASRLRAVAAGSAGDMFDDLGPLRSLVPADGKPWLFAALVATAVAVLIAAAGVVQGDPFDGGLRGAADGLACMTGFALLGRYLGLRSQ
jgi:hypothetical protein